jgi:hypothetical protein
LAFGVWQSSRGWKLHGRLIIVFGVILVAGAFAKFRKRTPRDEL